jgi:hypothetical protein
MQWNRRRIFAKDSTPWEPWFAWKRVTCNITLGEHNPVVNTYRRAWLETVYRRKVYHIVGNYFCYEYITKQTRKG